MPGCAVPGRLEAHVPGRVLAASLTCAPHNARGPPCHSSRPVPCRQPSLFNQAFNQSALGTKHGPADIFQSFIGDSFFVQPVFHEEEKATQILPGKGGVKIQITTIKIIPNYLSGKLKMTIVINNFSL